MGRSFPEELWQHAERRHKMCRQTVPGRSQASWSSLSLAEGFSESAASAWSVPTSFTLQGCGCRPDGTQREYDVEKISFIVVTQTGPSGSGHLPQWCSVVLLLFGSLSG